MMNTNHVCRVCGRHYQHAAMWCPPPGYDFTLCGACNDARDRAMKREDTEEQKRKRREAFGEG